MTTNIQEIEVLYKRTQEKRFKISSSADVFNYLRDTWASDIEVRERVKVLLLNTANEVTGYFELSSGGSAGSVIDPKIMFGVALKSNAKKIILAHNHPSGSLTPSKADIDVTKRIKSCGDLLELPLLDHVIISYTDFYYSFADEGLI